MLNYIILKYSKQGITTDWMNDMICPISTSSNNTEHKTQASEQNEYSSEPGYMIILLFLLFFQSCGVVIFKIHH